MKLSTGALALLSFSLNNSGSSFVSFVNNGKAFTSKSSNLKMSETSTIAPPEAEKFTFKAEVGRVMDIIVNSLYSNRDVFLRELTSNAADACDKKRFLSLTSDGSSASPEIKIKADKEKNMLLIEDSGVGMTRDELVNNLGSIAQSGTKKFLEAMGSEKKDDLNLIGQFGVGFYSSFLVADRVVMVSKSMTDKKVFRWESTLDGNDSYSISEVLEDPFEGDSGSQLQLYLKEDASEYLESSKLKDLQQKYSEFIDFPISLYEETTEYKSVPDEEANKDLKEGEEPKMKTVPETTVGYNKLNKTKPLWLRSPKEVTDEEYTEFYKTAFKSAYDEPMAHSHFVLEGSVEAKILLYVPGMLPFELSRDMFDENANNIRLYVKRVFINDKFEEIIPRWLKFVKGVVDSNDLPLNVGREILQRSKTLNVIRKRIVKKSLDMIKDVENDEDETKYITFWNNFGKYIKVGIIEDDGNRKEIASLLRFFSSTSDNEYRSLDQYVESMKEDQTSIYYITSDSREAAAKSPILEKISEKGFEVLFMVEPLDEITFQSLEQYKDYKLTDLSKEDLESFSDSDDDSEAKKAKQESLKEEYKDTVEFLEALLKGKIQSAKVTTLLTSSPATLAQGAYGMSPTMQKYMEAQSVATGAGTTPGAYNQAILEINPNNLVVQDLKRMVEESSPEKENYGKLLYDVAALSSGYDVEDSTDFAKRVIKLMNTNAVTDDEAVKEDTDDSDDEAVKEAEVVPDDEAVKEAKVVPDDEAVKEAKVVPDEE